MEDAYARKLSSDVCSVYNHCTCPGHVLQVWIMSFVKTES